MARSYRKHPIVSNVVADSEKADKQIAHRRERRSIRQRIQEAIQLAEIELIEDDLSVLADLREVSNVRDMAKDGKRYLKPEERSYRMLMK